MRFLSFGVYCGKTGEFEYVGRVERMLSEFWSLALGGSGYLMSACRSF